MATLFRPAGSIRFRSISPSKSKQHGVGVAGPVAGFSPPGGKLLLHDPQPLGVVASLRAQTLAQVVAQHHVPAAEDLGREELGQIAVGLLRSFATTDQVMDIAVQNEEAGRAGEIQIGQFPCPARTPGGKRVEQCFGGSLGHRVLPSPVRGRGAGGEGNRL